MREKETNKELELLEVVENLADECKMAGRNNFAIVLYSYLGAVKAGADKDFAEHCQSFARRGLKIIKKIKEKEKLRAN